MDVGAAIDLILEVAKQPEDLPLGVYVTVEDLMGDGFLVSYTDPSGEQLDRETHPIGGEVEAYVPDKDTGPCDDALIVRRAFVTKKWGPLLYDLMMELAGPRGIAMDREMLSRAALSVWNHYLNQRQDVEKVEFQSRCDDIDSPWHSEEEAYKYRYATSPRQQRRWTSSGLSAS